MQIYMTREFSKWARTNLVSYHDLVLVCFEIGSGLVEADLGGYLKKKRISLGSRGKRGGGRVLVCFKREQLCIFIYGYCKNELENLSTNEINAFKAISKALAQFSNKERTEREQEGSLIRVKYEK